MVVHAVSYSITRHLHAQGKLPRGGKVVDLGQVEWAKGSAAPLLADIHRHGGSDERKRSLEARLRDGVARNDGFLVGQVYYDLFYAPSRYEAIDLHGSPLATRRDLNHPVDLGTTFDAVINNGTAEHIFDICQVFRTVHQLAAAGGLMVHEAPVTGWKNHGFYTLQPTLFADLAAVNDYEIVSCVLCQSYTAEHRVLASPNDAAQVEMENALLILHLRKRNDAPFVVPMQGFYAGRT